MKNYLKLAAAFGMALSMLGAPLAIAQQDQHNDGQFNDGQHDSGQHDNGQHDNGQPGDQRGGPQHLPVQQQPVQQQPMQRQPPPQYQQHQPMQPQHRSEQSSSHHWQHGQHYHGSRRVVGNWQHYHLRQPPHGYEWVQDGSQFVLIGVASGIIAEVIANAFSQ